MLLAALLDGQRRRLVAKQFDGLAQGELQVLRYPVGVPVALFVDAVDQGRSRIRRERRRVHERGDRADRCEVPSAENLAEVETEQAALAPFLPVDEDRMRHRQQDHESRGVAQGEDALVDGGLGRVLPPLLDVDCVVDSCELLAAEPQVERASLEIGVTRRHGLHDPDSVAARGIGAQGSDRQQLFLGVGDQSEFARVTEGVEEFVGELAEDEEPLPVVALGLVLGGQAAPTRSDLLQSAIGRLPARLFLLPPARAKLLDVALENGLEVMLRVELVDVGDSGQFDRHRSTPENRD